MSWNTKTWSWVKKYFSVNPLSTDGMPAVGKFRTPAPGSRPEKYTEPTTHASNVANNYYFQRDVRRNYPRLAVYTQSKVAGLLEGASAQASLPPAGSEEQAPAKVAESKPLVEVLNTKKLYNQEKLAPTPTWGRQLKWAESEDFIHPGPDFPMRNYTTV
ncbi:hypothetical protein INT45_008876 [Circinella minor]|uniref:NADH dehydrogenase [ubiquinone] 1 alpha subcomplex subunit 7 n=1 Tax=Circinella minor TaxID=1195481 RepID=A0A8H7VGM4_9FUNG|nr:hypothetical protein INT45_008876 [Circinella minor]KAI7849122.1 hypothetical protein BDC45DRAFT_521600 [Circinella umbellata]